MRQVRDVAIVLIIVILGFILIQIALQDGQSSITGSVVLGPLDGSECNFIINESSTLTGDITNCNSNSTNNYGLIINTSDVILDCQGYKITRNVSDPFNDAGISITSGITNITIKNCVITDFASGVLVQPSSSALIFIENTIINETADVCNFGIFADNLFSGDLSVINNTISGCQNGVSASGDESRVINSTFNDISGQAVKAKKIINNNLRDISGIVFSNFIELKDNVVVNFSGVGASVGGNNVRNIANNTFINGTGSSSVFYSAIHTTGHIFEGNLIINSVGNAFKIYWAENSLFLNNVVNNSQAEAFFIQASINTTYSGNQIYNTTTGFYITQSSKNNIFVNNSIHGTATGFLISSISDVTGATNNKIIGNHVYNSTVGFYVSLFGYYTTLKNNFAYDNGIGFNFRTLNLNLLNNTAFNNSRYGFLLNSSSVNSSDNNVFYNNLLSDVYVAGPTFGGLLENSILTNPSGTLENYTVVSFSDSNLDYSGFFINWTAYPSVLPSVLIDDSFENKAIKIFAVSTWLNKIDLLNLYWTDAEAAGYDENQIVVWRDNGTSWEYIPQTRNAIGNYIELIDLTPESRYALFELKPNLPFDMEIYTRGYAGSTTVPIPRFDPITFYANITNSTGRPINNSEGAVVYLTFKNWTGTYKMAYNPASELWEYSFDNKTYYYGTFDYTINATIGDSAYNYILTDNFSVAEDCFDMSLYPANSIFQVIDDEMMCTNTYDRFNITFETYKNPLSLDGDQFVNDIVFDCDGSNIYQNVNLFSIGSTSPNINNITVRNCTSKIAGINVENATNILIQYMNILHTKQEAIYSHESTSGLKIINSNISRNSSGSQVGIRMDRTRNSLIKNVNFLLSDYSYKGIQLDDVNGVNITNISYDGNTLTDNLVEASGTNVIIYDNQFSDLTEQTASIFNVNLDDSIIYNNVFKNVYNLGAISASGTNLMVRDNYFENCSIGISLTGPSSVNSKVINNTLNCLIYLGEGQWTVNNNRIEGSTAYTSGIFGPVEFGGFYNIYGMSDTASFIVENNNIINTKDTLLIGVEGQLTIRNNIFSNITNITIMSSNGTILLSGNKINASDKGFYLINSKNVDVTSNIIKSTGYSIITDRTTNSRIWRNLFVGAIDVNSTANSFCVGGEGNFYEESLVPPTEDCGQVNLTKTTFIGNTISFKKQSSPIQPVHYEVYRNVSGNLSLVKSVSSSSSPIPVNWPSTDGVQFIVIMPWVDGSMINGTWFSGSFTITPYVPSSGSTSGGGGSSVNLPPTIGSFDKEKAVQEEIVPITQEEVEVDKKPTEVPAKPVEEKPAETEEKTLPKWVVPLVLIIIILIIIAVIFIYKNFLANAKPQHKPHNHKKKR